PAANGSQLAQNKPQRLVTVDNGAFANLLDTAKFEHLWRLSTAFSSSDLVPEQFRRKPENCFIGIQMAIRLGVDPFMFLQSCYVVHGRPGLEAKLAIALANSSGVFVGPIRYRLEGSGKTRKCTAFATVRETSETIEMTVDWAMVEAEGWNKKSGSKWLTIPEVMFRYRAAMLLIRTHCPEVIMGMQSKEELEDIAPEAATTVQRTLATAPSSLDALADRLSGIATDDAKADASTEVPTSGESAADPFAWCKTAADVESVYAELRAAQGGDPMEPGTDELETARVVAMQRVAKK
ncbi:MAG: hypothetical protein KGL35_17500, partial [Bradyrhizobium sp.]|nr:hypothetical protein [Bradyrhizobium sp.]